MKKELKKPHMLIMEVIEDDQAVLVTLSRESL